MPRQVGVRTLAALTVAMGIVAVFTAVRSSGQASATGVPRLQGKPNLNGIWQAVNEANWDLEPHPARPGPTEYGALFAEPAGLGVVDGNEIPYTPEALARKKENFANRWTLDPVAKCYMPGVPRATYMPFPFQIFQGSGDTMLVSYPFAAASRIIHMKDVGESPADAWMGWSRGRWDGDTLVVDVTNLIDQTWFDHAGNHHSDALKVTERYSMTSADIIQYEATIEDPNVFTRPWKMRMPLYRRVEPHAQLLEFKCVPFAEELIYGHLKRGATTER